MLGEDCRKYYNLERYLFDDVTARSRKSAALNAFDFFCIVVWKANRARSKVASRLMSPSRGKVTTRFERLEQATESLTRSIAEAEGNEANMRVPVEGWSLRLPMASAILTVLYPEEFTVYDTGVCDVVNDYHSVQDPTESPPLWTGYQKYLQAVREEVKENDTFRDKA